FDPSQSSIPASDFYYTRTIYSTTQADLVIQKSTRLSFDLGGGLFINRFASSALYGVTGEDARGDVQYRLSRRATIGANYSFTHYSYNGLFGASNFHRFSGTYATRFSASWEFTGYAGVTRAESEFPQLVTLDPVIAALLGITQGYVVTHRVNWL